MITSIGTFLKELRKANHENLKIMAGRLGVSSAFLSAVENGKKKFPRAWFYKISELYSLDDVQYGKLTKAVLESSYRIELNIENLHTPLRDLIIEIARNIEGLDNTMGEAMIDALNNMVVYLNMANEDEKNKK